MSYDDENPPSGRGARDGVRTSGRRRTDAPRQAGGSPRRTARDQARTARRSRTGAQPRSGDRRRTGGQARAADQGRARRRMPPIVFFGTAAGLAVILLAGVTILLLRGGSGPAPAPGAAAPATSGTAPAVYSDAPSTPTFDVIGERSADGGPLTADEVFPRGKTTLADGETHAKLQLRDQRVDTDCAQAIWGVTAASELRGSGCTQALRGVYADEKKGYAALFAIFNLAHAVDAGRFVHTITPGSGAGFVRPLPAAAPLDAFGRGFGMARGAAMGHYAVVVWVQRLDGTGDAKDPGLISLLVTAGNASPVYGRVAAHH